MKVLVLVLALSAVFVPAARSSTEAKAAPTSGVFLSPADYLNHRLSFPGSCRSEAHKLEVHDVLKKPYIDVIHAGEKRRYWKNAVFGFRACDGRDYRFGANLEYQILEDGELYIYLRESKTYGKGFQTRMEYFFSVGPEGAILPLTLGNLKQAVPENRRFHDSLDATLRSGQKLETYDRDNSMFHVNWLLMASRRDNP
jgi:hypothetical protein